MIAGQCSACRSVPCSGIGPCAPPAPPVPVVDHDPVDLVVVAPSGFRYQGRHFARDAFLVQVQLDDELRAVLALGRLERLNASNWPAPPPPPPPPDGLYVVQGAGITLGTSTLQAGPGTVVWLSGTTAQGFGALVRRLDLRELLALDEATQSTAPDGAHTKDQR